MNLDNKFPTTTSTVLFVSISAVGHVNASLGIACALKQNGHRVVFATDRSWKGKFLEYEIEEELFDEYVNSDAKFSGDNWTKFFVEAIEICKKPAIEQLSWLTYLLRNVFESVKFSEKQLAEIVSKVKPDAIIIESAFSYPCLIKSNLPLVILTSTNPLYALNDERLPPFCSGLPLSDNHEWNSFRKVWNEAINELWQLSNEWIEENNLPCLTKYNLRHKSTNINVCIYPEPLMNDYLRLCPVGNEWHILDHSIRKSSESFHFPPEFKQRNEKLIYLSMGSTGSNIVELMSRLVKLLANCKHKIIVVRGKFHDQYELAENMWGEPFLRQLEIIPLVDLVITHGGNNTFVETLYFGKPMIILPLLSDQHDNAQRAVESKIGVRFNPFLVEERELLKAIDDVLNDDEIKQNVQNISKKMKKSKSMDVLVQRIEEMIRNPKIPSIM